MNLKPSHRIGEVTAESSESREVAKAAIEAARKANQTIDFECESMLRTTRVRQS